MPEDLLEQGMDILRDRKVEFVERFMPYYISSVGCHFFNLMNQEKRVYYEFGDLPNLRMNIITCAPPGFSKSFIGRQLTHEVFGLFHNIINGEGELLLKTGFEGYMTEAGWVGSLETNPELAKWQMQVASGAPAGPKPEPIKLMGMAELYKKGIVTIDEFAAINAAISQSHSASLDSAILSSLDHGVVRKRLKAGLLEYTTFLTAWLGTQPARFDLSSGLGRRLFFILWIPSKKEQKMLVKAHWRGKNVSTPPSVLEDYKEVTARTVQKVNDIRSVNFASCCEDTFDALNRPHYEITLFERMAIGWYIMKGMFDRELNIEMNEDLQGLILEGCRWRDRLMTESEGDQVIQVLADNGGRMKEDTLKVALRRFGITYAHAEELLGNLERGKMVRRESIKGETWVVGRKG